MTGQTAEPPTGKVPLTERLREEARRYQRALERNPRDPEALAGMSLVALVSGQSEAAVRLARQTVLVAPAMGPAWVALGQALRAEGRPAEAENAYRVALCLDGMDPLARLGLGEVKLAGERAEEALIEFDLALRREPAMIAAYLGMGHALTFLKRYGEALASYDRALLLRPRQAEGEFAAGYVLSRMARPGEAEKRYRRALALRPDFGAAWMNLGCLLRDEGRELHARAALERAVELRPESVSSWINLALLERECGRAREAEEDLRRAFALNPSHPETHVAWAHFCAARGDHAGARGWLRWALARDEKNDEAVNTNGILLHAEGRFAEAVDAFRQAEALGSMPATSNRGNSLLELGRMPEALAAHRAAVGREPHHAGARYNLALTQLRLGEWTTGWRNYESRWNFREVHREPRRFEQPRWNGEPINGGRILLHAEQGLGDTIQFCRYAALVAERGGVPILHVQAPVERLMRSLAVVRAGRAEVAQLGTEPPRFDLECPLMSLPAVFGTTVETVPWTGAYLGAEVERRAVGEDSRSLRVGLAWAGNPRYKADARRSMKLATLAPLLRAPNVTFVSLQKGLVAEQIAEEIAGLAAGVHVIDGCSNDTDLADAAALIATLDLVITTDTSIAHLAGAMAKPVWILLPHLADWRWMQDAEITPWYPTAHLIRQSAPGDWAGVIEKVRTRLQMFRG